MCADLARRERRAARRVPADTFAVDDVERVFRRLHQLGGDVDGLVAQLQRRAMRRRAGHDGGARGMRADPVLDLIGAPMDDTDAPIIDAQGLGANLSDDRLEALADRRAAGDDLDHTIGTDADADTIGWAKPALFDEQRQPGADCFALSAAGSELGLQLRPPGGREGLIEEADVIAGIVFDLFAQRFERPRVGHFFRPDRVAAPYLVRIDAEL